MIELQELDVTVVSVIVRTCLMCPNPLSGRQKKYCSVQCNQNFHYRTVISPRDKSLRVESQESRRCSFCPNEIPLSLQGNAVFCSSSCRSRAKYQRTKGVHKAGRDRRRQGEQWRVSHRVHVQRRRALIAEASYVSFTVDQLSARLSMFAGCWMCGSSAWSHIEHVKPLARGGPHALCNLRPSCVDCNLRKGSTWHGVGWVLQLREVAT